MDVALLLVTAIASAAAVASAIVAIAQARAAKASERDALSARDESRTARDQSVRLASEANDAFVRQANAQERMNALKEAESKPTPWSGPRHVGGDTYAITNTSGRAVRVSRMVTRPPEAEEWLHVDGNSDGLYAFGQGMDVIYSSNFPIRPQSFTLYWRYEEEPESELSEFMFIL
jgi:hypothetical protein